jgi:hypothetical protein
MPINHDHKRVIRVTGILVALGGSATMLAMLVNFLRAVRDNAIEGGPALLRFPEYYRQVGTYYSRGFMTGFFLCYFLTLFAVIVGTWVDQILNARRATAVAGRPSSGEVAQAARMVEP